MQFENVFLITNAHITLCVVGHNQSVDGHQGGWDQRAESLL